jgi:predicted nucleotidyltransferase
MAVSITNIIGIVREFKELLKAVHKDNLKAVILYGSMARGDFDDESDIDVLVVLNEMSDYVEELDKTFQIQYELEMKYDCSFIISCVLTTSKDYETKIEPLFLNIHREGILI